VCRAKIHKLIDLALIIGADLESVKEQLGAGQCKTEKNSKLGKVTACEYKKDNMEIEITFIGKKADWVSVDGPAVKKLPLESRALSSFGLTDVPPTSQTAAGLFWGNSLGWLDVSLFGNNGFVDYLHVKAQTE
jgi:hypothetical protein